MEIKWKKGDFVKLYSKVKMAVGGGPANVSLYINKGEEIEYDGTTLKFSGMEVIQPSLRGSIVAGWFTLNSEGDSKGVSPYVTKRNVASSQSKNSDLLNVQRLNSTLSTDSLDENTVMNVNDRRGKDHRDEPNRLVKNTIKVNRDLESTQEGVVIARLRTPTKVVADITTSEGQRIESSVKSSAEGHNAGTPVYERENRGSKIIITDSDPDPLGMVGKPVGRVSSIQDRESSRGSSRPTSSSNKPTTSKKSKVETEEGSKSINTKINPKVRIARSICPSFPSNWDFTGKLQDRLSRVMEYDTSPQFLEALYAAEGDQMRKLLEKTFPKQFH